MVPDCGLVKLSESGTVWQCWWAGTTARHLDESSSSLAAAFCVPELVFSGATPVRVGYLARWSHAPTLTLQDYPLMASISALSAKLTGIKAKQAALKAQAATVKADLAAAKDAAKAKKAAKK